MKQYFGKEIPIEDEYLELALHNKKFNKPESIFQALMETPPCLEPEEHSEEIDFVREAIIDAIDSLSDQDKFIVEAVNYERLTYCELGERMGISNAHAWRLKQAAFSRLESKLLENEVIRQKVGA